MKINLMGPYFFSYIDNFNLKLQIVKKEQFTDKITFNAAFGSNVSNDTLWSSETYIRLVALQKKLANVPFEHYSFSTVQYSLFARLMKV